MLSHRIPGLPRNPLHSPLNEWSSSLGLGGAFHLAEPGVQKDTELTAPAAPRPGRESPQLPVGSPDAACPQPIPESNTNCLKRNSVSTWNHVGRKRNEEKGQNARPYARSFSLDLSLGLLRFHRHRRKPPLAINLKRSNSPPLSASV